MLLARSPRPLAVVVPSDAARRRHALFRLAAIAAPAIVVPLIVAACGAGSGDRATNGASEGGKERAGTTTAAARGGVCAKSDTSPVSLAVREYATKAMPSAQFFLSAYGTDSALPEDGFRTLQDKGPSRYYGGDSAALAKQRATLAQLGPYNSLLVVYRGQTTSADGSTVDVRLGGHYVAGVHEGELATSKRFTVRCDSAGWRLAATTDEPPK
jgi:hypothetical protein